jgi:hypothetical protein
MTLLQQANTGVLASVRFSRREGTVNQLARNTTPSSGVRLIGPAWPSSWVLSRRGQKWARAESPLTNLGTSNATIAPSAAQFLALGSLKLPE